MHTLRHMPPPPRLPHTNDGKTRYQCLGLELSYLCWKTLLSKSLAPSLPAVSTFFVECCEGNGAGFCQDTSHPRTVCAQVRVWDHRNGPRMQVVCMQGTPKPPKTSVSAYPEQRSAAIDQSACLLTNSLTSFIRLLVWDRGAVCLGNRIIDLPSTVLDVCRGELVARYNQPSFRSHNTTVNRFLIKRLRANGKVLSALLILLPCF